jgi:hypothetical protein
MPTFEEVKGDYDCVANIVAWKFPMGLTGKYRGAEDTNSR